MARMTHPVDDTIRVLFVQDDPAVAEMYKLKLELDGYQVTIVSGRQQLIDRTHLTARGAVDHDLFEIRKLIPRDHRQLGQQGLADDRESGA